MLHTDGHSLEVGGDDARPHFLCDTPMSAGVYRFRAQDRLVRIPVSQVTRTGADPSGRGPIALKGDVGRYRPRQ
jgi:hypothetical protein